MNSLNVPKLRFPGFNGQWEEKKILDVAPLQRGFDLPVIDIKQGKYPVVFSNGILKTHNEFKAKAPGVVTGRSGTIGKITFVEEDYWPHNTSLWVTDFKNNDPKYIYFFYSNFKLERLGTGSGVPTLNRNDIHVKKSFFPTVPEQQKIASFLSAVDEKVQQLSRKKELLEQYKKGVMQQLFSGKLRFKDENGKEYPDWDYKVLDDVIHFVNGKGHEQSIDENGDFVVVNSKFVSTQGKVRKFCNTQISPLTKGDIVMVMSDVPNGKALAKCYLIEKDNLYTLNQRICGLKANKDNLNEFLIYLINRNKYYLSFDSGVGQTNLKKDEVLNCPLFIPTSIKEQQKIAIFLSGIDGKIEQVNGELVKTQEFKKGLLQQMFV